MIHLKRASLFKAQLKRVKITNFICLTLIKEML